MTRPGKWDTDDTEVTDPRGIGTLPIRHFRVIRVPIVLIELSVNPNAMLVAFGVNICNYNGQ